MVDRGSKLVRGLRLCLFCMFVYWLQQLVFFSCGKRASELSRPWAASNAKKTQSLRILRSPKTSSREGSNICSAPKVAFTLATNVVAHTRTTAASRRSTNIGSNRVHMVGIVRNAQGCTTIGKATPAASASSHAAAAEPACALDGACAAARPSDWIGPD